MVGFLLHLLIYHVHYKGFYIPKWVVFPVIFGAYILPVFSLIVNGYARELLGSHVFHIGKIHRVLWQFHTGRHAHPDRSYGDEAGQLRLAGAQRRTVQYHRWTRWQRALRNNAIILAYLLMECGMAIYPRATVQVVSFLAVFAAIAWAVYLIRRKRREIMRRRPVAARPVVRARVARLGGVVEPADDNPLAEVAPRLYGISNVDLATLLADRMGCSAAEILDRLTTGLDQNTLMLPDRYAALQKDRDVVEEIIQLHTKGNVGFTWSTTTSPRTLVWVPLVQHRLPDLVRFRDYLDQIQRLGPREWGIGVLADRTMYTGSHQGDFPWWCRFAGPGTGKTTGFMVKAAQICHNDPLAELYCVDTKQVSFRHLVGIPRVYVFDNPQSEMDKIWKVFYILHKIMQDRYTAVREGRVKLEDLNDIWILIDEGNDLSAQLKSYSRRIEGENTPAIWGEAIAPLMRMGREARIFGEFMCQDLDGRMFGGETLKTAFNGFGAAGFSKGQFTRSIGTPAEECIDGPGKIMMIKGKKREWVQGFTDDMEWLRAYAMENRREIAA